jgi:hypothetical protein
VLPVLLDRCRIPSFLSDKLYADFTRPENFDGAVDRLLNALGFSDKRVRLRPGIAIEWTSEGPRIFGHNTVISATEAAALLDRYEKWFPKFIHRLKKQGKPKQYALSLAPVLACCRAFRDTYNRIPEEPEMKAARSESSRKLNLFFLFLDAMLGLRNRST